ncbi:MAG: MMPL family transporter [Pseudomonadota bacterium]
MKLMLWIINHPRRVIAATLLLVVVAAAGLARLQQTADYRIYFNPDDPHLAAAEALQETYVRSDNVLFVLAPRDGQVFSADTLGAVKTLTAKAWKLPYGQRVDSLTNFQYSYADGDTLVVRDLVPDPAAINETERRAVRDIALQEPALARRLISPDGKVTGINVTVNLPRLHPDQENREVADAARALAAEIKAAYPQLDIHVTGVVMMNNAFPEASERDMATLIPIMFALIIVVLWGLMRSWSATVITVVILACSILVAMGIAGWLGIKLSPASGSAPIIILTVVVADCAHMLTHILHLMRHEGKSHYAALDEALRVNAKAVVLTSVTTAVGFLSMNFSDAPPFRDLGNITAVGVVVALLMTLVFLPALLALWPLRVKPAAVSRKDLFMVRVADFVVSRRRPLLWGVTVVSLVIVAFVPRNQLDDQFVKYFDESIEVRQATDFTTRNLTGISLIEYSLPAGEAGGISEPDFLRYLDMFAIWYRAQPEVKHVDAFSDVMKRLNKNMHGDDPAAYRLPEQRELAAQYLLLYELSLPYGLDLNNQINVDKSATRMTVLVGDVTNNQLLALEERARQWQSTHLPAAMQAPGVGWSIMFSHIAERNIHSMLQGTPLAIVLISILLMFAFRSVKLGLLSLLPNVLPALLTFGIWGMLVGQIGLAASIITAMTLGVVVDDTIHLISTFLYARRERGLAPEDAMRFALSTSGWGIVVMSTVLFAGFMVLSFSTFQVNSVVGLLSAITILGALTLDFLLTPALVLKFEERRILKQQRAALRTA